ncbi:MAG TPA: ACP phosphodiesterase [Azospira sp.]|nr:ACP phosphodiesterase [Azospira sp.]
MNFLAHAYLAGPEASDRLGGLLGDFVKGPLAGLLATGLPEAVVAGVELHRRIDSFADAHPAFQRSRARLSGARRRYGGIVADMAYDHFLARFWGELIVSEELGSLEEFAAGTYALLADNGELLPPRLAAILPAMTADNWLVSYRELASVSYALDRMAQRLSRPNGLFGAGAELAREYAGFESDFRAFLPDARAFAAAHRAGREPLPGGG